MSRTLVAFLFTVVLGCTVSGSAAAADAPPAAPGTLVELKRATALDRVLASRGVVLVDCFADW